MKSLYCRYCGKLCGEMASGSKVIREGFEVICGECFDGIANSGSLDGLAGENFDVPDLLKGLFGMKGEK